MKRMIQAFWRDRKKHQNVSNLWWEKWEQLTCTKFRSVGLNGRIVESAKNNKGGEVLSGILWSCKREEGPGFIYQVEIMNAHRYPASKHVRLGAAEGRQLLRDDLKQSTEELVWKMIVWSGALRIKSFYLSEEDFVKNFFFPVWSSPHAGGVFSLFSQ